jgi:polysaccharide biosynthesis PFTS motif protein
MSVPLTKNSKLYISSYMQRLLNKKVNLTASSRIELMQIKLPFFKKIKIILIALILFLFYCTKIFRIAPKKNKIRENKTVLFYSLTKDQIFKDNSISKLHDFLVSKKFNISEKNEILIECRWILRSRMYSNLVVTFDIPLKIFTTKLSLKGQLKLLLVFFCKLTILVKSFNNSQYIYLVFKEYVFDENVYLAIANKNTINKIITTPTATQYQPISFEIPDFAVERVMLWYSANSIPIKYKSRKTSIFEKNLENSLQRMAIDTHWVWTNEHKKYLKKMTNSAILVRGSMIFYNPTKKLDSNKKYDVVIFDVTPQNSKSVFKDTIYSFPVAKEFIEDIIESVDLVSQKLDRNIGIYIKHKRNFAPTHSSKYIAYIDALAKNRQLSVLPLDSDLYEIIATSKIVIGFPFTSPVIIGQELKVPSIYYSSTSTLVKYNQANFIQSKLELRKYIETNLGK